MKGVVAGVVAVLLGAASVAAAAPAEIRLRYLRGDGAEGCPDESAVRNAVMDRLGYLPFDDHAAVVITVAVTRTPTGLRADIELADERGPRGHRQLDSRDERCGDLGPAIELALTLAIDALRVITPPTPIEKAPAPLEKPTPPIAPIAIAEKPPQDKPTEKRSPFHLRFGTGFHGAIGSAPTSMSDPVQPTFGIDSFIGIRRGRWSLDLEVRFDAIPTSAEAQDPSIAPGNPQKQLSTTLVLVELSPCIHFGSFAACALAAAGAVDWVSNVADGSASGTNAWLGAGARAAVELPLSRRTSIALRLDLLVPFIHRDFQGTDAAGHSVEFVTPYASGALSVVGVGDVP